MTIFNRDQDGYDTDAIRFLLRISGGRPAVAIRFAARRVI